jgi:hypothetical protein
MRPTGPMRSLRQWAFCLLLTVICEVPFASAEGAEATEASFSRAAQLYRNQAYKEAMAIFLVLAKEGDVRAQTALAMMFRYGEGARVNPETAFKIYQLAANAGHAPAQYQVGVMLRDGEGTPADIDQAKRWFRSAAIQDYDKARFALEDLSPEMREVPIIEAPVAPRTQPWDFSLPDQLASTSNPSMTLSNASNFERGFRVQLAAMRTKAAAIDLWGFLNQEFPQLLAGLPYTVSVYQPTPSDAPLYRLRAGDFRSEESARRFCDIISPVTRRSCWLLSAQESDDG